MNYEEALNWMARVSKRGSRPGLDSIRMLLAELGNPQDQLVFVHIAGTNGKGSVMTFLEQTLICAGHRTGRFLSPAVFCREETIRVDGAYIPKETVAGLAQTIQDAMERMEKKGQVLPTIFEAETAMAFLYFQKEKCDLVLLEAGMGGREDATNVIGTGVIELFSSVSMDHMQYLGNTLQEIARTKSGILKPGTLAASDTQPEEAEQVLRQAAGETGVPICFVDAGAIKIRRDELEEQQFSYTCSGPLHTYYENVTIHLAGAHQLHNAALALEAVDLLRLSGYTISGQAVTDGFSRARWRGRLEILHRDPLVLADGAHNPDAAGRLRQAVDRYFPGRRIYCIFGVFSDKEYDKIIDIMEDCAFRIYTVQAAGNPRAMDAAELARIAAGKHPDVVCAGQVSTALDLALKAAGKEDVVLLFGSLAWLKEADDFFAHTEISPL